MVAKRGLWTTCSFISPDYVLNVTSFICPVIWACRHARTFSVTFKITQSCLSEQTIVLQFENFTQSLHESIHSTHFLRYLCWLMFLNNFLGDMRWVVSSHHVQLCAVNILNREQIGRKPGRPFHFNSGPCFIFFSVFLSPFVFPMCCLDTGF